MLGAAERGGVAMRRPDNHGVRHYDHARCETSVAWGWLMEASEEMVSEVDVLELIASCGILLRLTATLAAARGVLQIQTNETDVASAQALAKDESLKGVVASVNQLACKVHDRVAQLVLLDRMARASRRISEQFDARKTELETANLPHGQLVAGLALGALRICCEEHLPTEGVAGNVETAFSDRALSLKHMEEMVEVEFNKMAQATLPRFRGERFDKFLSECLGIVGKSRTAQKRVKALAEAEEERNSAEAWGRYQYVFDLQSADGVRMALAGLYPTDDVLPDPARLDAAAGAAHRAYFEDWWRDAPDGAPEG